MKNTITKELEKFLYLCHQNNSENEVFITSKQSKVYLDYHRKSFIVFKLGGSVTWLVDERSPIDLALLKNAVTRRAQLKMAMLRIVSKLKLLNLFFSRIHVYSKAPLNIVQDLDLKKEDRFSVFLGTHGSERNITIAVVRKDDVIEYAKYMNYSSGVKKANKAKAALKAISLQEINNLQVPHLIDNEKAQLLHTSMPHVNLKKDQGFCETHAYVLSELFNLSNSTMHFANSDLKMNAQFNLSLISVANPYKRAPILSRRLAELLKEIDPTEKIVKSLGHGDFAPWNMQKCKEGLYVFDWEYASDSIPALFDLIHYHFQRASILGKEDLNGLIRNIEQSLDYPGLKRIIDLYHLDLHTYLKYYVLKAGSFQLASYETLEKVSDEQVKMCRLYEELIDRLSPCTDKRTRLIEDFNSWLHNHEHCYLKLTEPDLRRLSVYSDIDLLVRKGTASKAKVFLQEFPEVSKLSQYKRTNMRTLKLFLNNGQFLSIDLISELKRKSLVYMNPNPILRSAQINKSGFKVPSWRFDLENMLLFYSLNRASIPRKYQFYQAERSYAERERIWRFLSGKYGLEIQSYSQLFELGEKHFKQINKRVEGGSVRAWYTKLNDKWNYFKDALNDIFNSRSMMITLNGVDGAGKSTVLSELKQILSRKYRREVVLLRHRPGVLPMLRSFVVGKAKAEEDATFNKPRSGSNGSKLSSLLRFSYYYADYIIGQFIVKIKYGFSGKIVLYDRYYFDFIVDRKRSNIVGHERLIKFLFRFIQKPDLNILLWAEPEQILKRKQELNELAIIELTSSYKSLFSELKSKHQENYVILENKDLNTTLQFIERSFSKLAS